MTVPLEGQSHLLRDAEYRKLWTAQTLSTFGDAFFRVAQVAVVLKLGGNAVGLSGVLLSNVLPGIVFSVLGGVWADRFERRRLLVVVNFVRTLVMLVAAGLILTNTVTLIHLYVLGVFLGSLSAVANPAYNALLPSIIPEQRLQEGNALFSVGDSIGYVAGPALAGVLLATIGAGGLTAVNAVALAFMTFTLLILRVAQVEGEAQGSTGLLSQVGEGWRWVSQQPTMLRFLALFAAVNLATPVLGVALPLYVRETLHADTAVYGFLLAAMNIGIIVSSALLSRLQISRAALGTALALIGIGLSGYVGVGLTRSIVLAMLLLAVSDGLAMIPNILFPTWVQKTTPADLQGRVFGLVSVATYALVPVGYILSGVAISRFSPHFALMLAGMLLVVVALISLTSRSFRSART